MKMFTLSLVPVWISCETGLHYGSSVVFNLFSGSKRCSEPLIALFPDLTSLNFKTEKDSIFTGRKVIQSATAIEFWNKDVYRKTAYDSLWRLGTANTPLIQCSRRLATKEELTGRLQRYNRDDRRHKHGVFVWNKLFDSPCTIRLV